MTPSQTEDYLKSSKAKSWLKGYAGRIARQQKAFDYDDLMQEGLVAMWRAHRERDHSNPGSMDSYLIQAAKWKILNLLDGKSLTGGRASSQRSNKGEKKLRWHEAESAYDHRTMADWDQVAITDPLLEAVGGTGISARVADALSKLTPTQHERIYRKFWLDEVVYTSGRWWYDPKCGARAILREELADLRRSS